MTSTPDLALALSRRTLATGSQLDRIARCEPSAALPQVIEADDEDGSHEARKRGSAMHAFLERCGAVGREAALVEVDSAHREFCASIELAKLGGRLQLSREVAVAYNWRDDTARLLQPVTPRAYEVDPSCEVPLTLDLVGAGDGAVYVGDYKSGHGWLPDPQTSMQLGGGALAVARLFRKRRAVVEYIRIRDDGAPYFYRAELDAFGLEAIAQRIREMLEPLPAMRARIEAGYVPDVVTGRWCKYCPARHHCPAKTALIRHVMTDPQPIPYLLPLTPESAARAYALLRPAFDALKQIEKAIYAYAKLTPIPVGVEEDGSRRIFGELRREGHEELDGAIAHAVLTELYTGEDANGAVTMETTKKAISAVVRKHLGPDDKVGDSIEAVYQTIRDRGGRRTKETCTTTEYTVDADGVATARKRKSA